LLSSVLHRWFAGQGGWRQASGGDPGDARPGWV